MEKRLQLLLDQHRYGLVEKEAKKSGRSVAAVIREAIDFRFDDDSGARAAAAGRLLVRTRARATSGQEPDWAESKAALDAELDEKFDKFYQ